MKLLPKLFCRLWFALAVLVAHPVAAQNPPAPAPKAQAPQRKSDSQTRITIEVFGGEKDTPVENASVYVKYIEEHAIKRDKKLELNVKTNRDGVAHVPDAPLGRVLIQVVAEGWKTHGRWYDITDPKQIIKVHLEKPPKWY
jgi:molecular chaperone DnaK (HSP70)